MGEASLCRFGKLKFPERFAFFMLSQYLSMTYKTNPLWNTTCFLYYIARSKF